MKQRLLKLVKGKEFAPVDVVGLVKFEACDEDVQYFTNSTFAGHIIPQIKNLKTSHTIWTTLQNLYENFNNLRVLYLCN
jgi:hypothetical protein